MSRTARVRRRSIGNDRISAPLCPLPSAAIAARVAAVLLGGVAMAMFGIGLAAGSAAATEHPTTTTTTSTAAGSTAPPPGGIVPGLVGGLSGSVGRLGNALIGPEVTAPGLPPVPDGGPAPLDAPPDGGTPRAVPIRPAVTQRPNPGTPVTRIGQGGSTREIGNLRGPQTIGRPEAAPTNRQGTLSFSRSVPAALAAKSVTEGGRFSLPLGLVTVILLFLVLQARPDRRTAEAVAPRPAEWIPFE